MKMLRIPIKDRRTLLDPDYLKKRLEEAGFNTLLPIQEKADHLNSEIVYTQED